MILFLDDWQRFPQAVVHTETKNKSFLRYSMLLRDMQVKNYLFPLQLFNKELANVDPYDPKLSTEQMLMVAQECKINPFYFFREISRDPKGTVDFILPFKANRGNMALYWLFFNHITTILIQIRQTGKSFSIDTLDNYLLNIGCNNTDIALLTKDDDLRGKNLIRLKNITETLPFYLKMRNRHDVGNTENLTVKRLKNSYTGYVPSKSPKDAELKGRGITSHIVRFDEAAYFYNLAITLPSCLAATTAAIEIAKLKNIPYGITITTTSGKKDDKDGGYVYRLVQESCVWTEKLFDCENQEDLENVIRKNSSSEHNPFGSKRGVLRVNCTFNHRQLGYTDEWLMEVIERTVNEGGNLERDLLNRWTSGSLVSPLKDYAEIIRDSEVSDPYNEISEKGYIVRWYIKEHEINHVMNRDDHLLCVDTSNASGGDDLAVVGLNQVTGAVTFAGNYNETNLIEFADWLCSWLIKYNKITLMIENRSSGQAIIDLVILKLLSQDIDPFKRIYNKVVQESDVYDDRYKEMVKTPIHKKDRLCQDYKKLFGFATSANGAENRSDLYGVILQNAAKLCGSLVKDKKLIDQLLSLVIRNNRVDHDIGQKDDMCIAWLLGFWLMLRGKNLAYYGVDSTKILSRNNEFNKKQDPITIYESEYNEEIKEEINDLTERIKKCRDENIINSLENRIRSLCSELTNDEQTIKTVDELLISLKKQKSAGTKNKFRFFS